jgi:hypothetical protein
LKRSIFKPFTLSLLTSNLNPSSGKIAHFSPGIDEIRAQDVVGSNELADGIATNNPKSLTPSLAITKERLNMSFTRVEQDGVEFYTLKTGVSGMSISGLARLCGIDRRAISRLLKRIHGTKLRSEWLKSFLGKDLCLGLNSVSGAKIIHGEACVAIIGYYAFEARYKTKAAEYAFKKFAYMGLEAWIQSITGWQPQASPELNQESVEAFVNDFLPEGKLAVAIHPDEIIKLLQQSKLSADGYRLYLYLEMLSLQEQTPTIDHICETLNISLSTFKKWLPKVHQWSRCADWIQLRTRQGTEFEIQCRMHQELGGDIEVHTIAGRIDLVTPTEVIEIKKIANWKDSLGEVLAKGAFFPKHRKRIHLFGASDKLMTTILASCTPLNIAVTFETIGQS